MEKKIPRLWKSALSCQVLNKCRKEHINTKIFNSILHRYNMCNEMFTRTLCMNFRGFSLCNKKKNVLLTIPSVLCTAENCTSCD